MDNKENDKNQPNSYHEDGFLQMFVELANAKTFSMGITLQVGGFLVSGELIGNKEYFKGIGDAFVSGVKGIENKDEIRDAFYSCDEYDIENVSKRRPQFIHLKNARFYNATGNPIPTRTGVWWRGRISKVQGFILGELSIERI